MGTLPEPSPQNHYLAEHIALLRNSFHRLLGEDLIDPSLDDIAAAQAIYHAPFVVLSHGTEADPVFNYGNQTAQTLFEMTWEELTALPSRQSAALPTQAARARLLEAVTTQGYIRNYEGIRIAKSGRRFWIRDVTVWNLTDSAGSYAGQAAIYSNWELLA